MRVLPTLHTLIKSQPDLMVHNLAPHARSLSKIW